MKFLFYDLHETRRGSEETRVISTFAFAQDAQAAKAHLDYSRPTFQHEILVRLDDWAPKESRT